VTALVVDPEEHRTIWAGIEVDGVRRSLDGGDTWTTMAGGLTDPDIHGLALSAGPPKTVLATTPREVFASTTAGESWQRLEVMQQFPYAYTRAIAVKADNPRVIFVGHGTTASPTVALPGSNGEIFGAKGWSVRADGAAVIPGVPIPPRR